MSMQYCNAISIFYKHLYFFFLFKVWTTKIYFKILIIEFILLYYIIFKIRKKPYLLSTYCQLFIIR